MPTSVWPRLEFSLLLLCHPACRSHITLVRGNKQQKASQAEHQCLTSISVCARCEAVYAAS